MGKVSEYYRNKLEDNGPVNSNEMEFLTDEEIAKRLYEHQVSDCCGANLLYEKEEDGSLTLWEFCKDCLKCFSIASSNPDDGSWVGR